MPTDTVSPSAIRPARNSDSEGIIAVIAACWAQHPGVRMDVDLEMPELRALASYYADHGGAVWTAETAGEITGMVATRPHEAGAWEICRVYVLPALHGSGLGHRLLDTAETHARAAGATRLVLWSDTRFDRAHRFYEKRSYVRSGPIRVLHDISNSLEFAYAKPMNGIVALDAAATASAEPRLCDILTACVAEGAGVSFLPPLARETARRFWRGIAKDVAAGSRIVLGAWVDGELSGTVMLGFPGAENQPHRADVQKLMVHPAARRAGVARALMQRLEHEAARAGRYLLVLDTRAGDRAERLYRSMGWNEVGRIPGYALKPDRTPDDTLFFWKSVRPDNGSPDAGA